MIGERWENRKQTNLQWSEFSTCPSVFIISVRAGGEAGDHTMQVSHSDSGETGETWSNKTIELLAPALDLYKTKPWFYYSRPGNQRLSKLYKWPSIVWLWKNRQSTRRDWFSRALAGANNSTVHTAPRVLTRSWEILLILLTLLHVITQSRYWQSSMISSLDDSLTILYQTILKFFDRMFCQTMQGSFLFLFQSPAPKTQLLLFDILESMFQ